MSKKYKRTLFRFPFSHYLEDENSSKTCDHPNCHEPGEYKAPKSRYNLKDYFYFCKHHVSEYNKNWNFCEGMSAEEIEELLIQTDLWERKTKPFATTTFYKDSVDTAQQKFNDFFGKKYDQQSIRKEIYPLEVQDALDKLDLVMPETYEDIKVRYKFLVKKYHPDINPDQKNSEEQLKRINEAYEIIKNHKSLWS